MMTLILHNGYLLELVPGNFYMFVNFNLHSGCLLYCCIDDKKEPKKERLVKSCEWWPCVDGSTL